MQNRRFSVLKKAVWMPLAIRQNRKPRTGLAATVGTHCCLTPNTSAQMLRNSGDVPCVFCRQFTAWSWVGAPCIQLEGAIACEACARGPVQKVPAYLRFVCARLFICLLVRTVGRASEEQ